MENKINYSDHIKASNGSLWGMAGGQLEYVGQDIVTRQDKDNPNRWDTFIRLKFTDHDMQNSGGCYPEIEPGVYYIIEVPLAV